MPLRVWPSVVLASMFIAGFVHGNDKQANLIRAAKARVNDEEQLIEKYVHELQEEKQKQEAAARGEDASLYNVPPGLRNMAKTIKTNRDKNAAATTN
ncbi:hypothetical protein ABK040_007166 [Willaertia magna]